MLSAEESQLLYDLGSEGGTIVDAGCFLGGSTIALAQGLRDSGRDGQIWVYDRFTVEDYTVGWFDGLRSGDSFRQLFDRNMAGFADLLRVHEGDICSQPFPESIDVLFLDVLKTWRICDAVVPVTFSRLQPGSTVIQQDWGSGTLPWVTLTMERMAPWFEAIDDVGPSRVYRLREPIPAEVLHERRVDLDPASMVTTYRQVVDSLTGTARGLQAVNLAFLSFLEVSDRQGFALLDDAEREFRDDPQVMACCADVRSWLTPVVRVAAVGSRATWKVRRAAARRAWRRS